MPDWLQYLILGLLGVGIYHLRELVKAQAGFDARLTNLATTRLEAGAQKQGEFDAIKTNLETIKGHVETTERTTATIKAEVEAAQWNKREVATLLRTKLEELLFASQEISAREDDDWNLATSGKQSALPNPRIKVEVLSSLYFRRLRQEANAVTASANQLELLAIRVRASMADKNVAVAGATAQPQVAAAHDKSLAEYRQFLTDRFEHRKALFIAQAILLGKAGEVVNEIFGQDIGLAIDYASFVAAAPEETQLAPTKPAQRP